MSEGTTKKKQLYIAASAQAKMNTHYFSVTTTLLLVPAGVEHTSDVWGAIEMFDEISYSCELLPCGVECRKICIVT